MDAVSTILIVGIGMLLLVLAFAAVVAWNGWWNEYWFLGLTSFIIIICFTIAMGLFS